MTTISGVYSPRLVSLRPILKRWIRLNKKIAWEWRSWKEVPWWYNERASLSVLAGAVWQSKGLVFEEYSDEKRSRSDKAGSRFRGYIGRVDIYFEINWNYFIGESKFCWVGASTLWRDETGYMKTFLERAKRDIRKSRPYKQRRLAILFASPFISKKRKNDIEPRINYFIDQATELDSDAVAWVFPNVEKAIAYDGWIYPGTAVIIKEVKR